MISPVVAPRRGRFAAGTVPIVVRRGDGVTAVWSTVYVHGSGETAGGGVRVGIVDVGEWAKGAGGGGKEASGENSRVRAKAEMPGPEIE
jgi:hypothetical protein